MHGTKLHEGKHKNACRTVTYTNNNLRINTYTRKQTPTFHFNACFGESWATNCYSVSVHEKKGWETLSDGAGKWYLKCICAGSRNSKKLFPQLRHNIANTPTKVYERTEICPPLKLNNDIKWMWAASFILRNCHEIAWFKVMEKWYNVVTRTAEPREAKTAQTSQRNKASNAVMAIQRRATGVTLVKFFRRLKVCNLVTAATVSLANGQKFQRTHSRPRRSGGWGINSAPTANRQSDVQRGCR
jgi:hypothetical protein